MFLKSWNSWRTLHPDSHRLKSRWNLNKPCFSLSNRLHNPLTIGNQILYIIYLRIVKYHHQTRSHILSIQLASHVFHHGHTKSVKMNHWIFQRSWVILIKVHVVKLWDFDVRLVDAAENVVPEDQSLIRAELSAEKASEPPHHLEFGVQFYFD